MGETPPPDFLLGAQEDSEHEMLYFSDLYPLVLYSKGRILFPKLAIFQNFLLLALLYNGNSIFFKIGSSSALPMIALEILLREDLLQPSQ